MSDERYGAQSESGDRPSPERGAPPWKRAASQSNADRQENPLPTASGQLTDDLVDEPPVEEQSADDRGDDYEDQPTMIHRAVSPDDDEILFAPGGGNEGDSASGARRGSVNVSGGAAKETRGGGTPSALRRPGRGPRRASLQLKRVDPWSVLKLAFVLSVAFFLVLMVAVGLLYAVLSGMGVWDKVNGTYTDLVSPADGASPEPLITIGRVFGITAIVGVVNIILFTALATVGAFVYNVSADLAGGVEVTLAERE